MLKKKIFLYQLKSHISKGLPIEQISQNHPLAKPNKKDFLENTALHNACDNNDIDEVVYLLSYPHIDPNIQDYWENTPLHTACTCRELNPEIVKLLLTHPKTDPNIPNKYHEAPLHTLFRNPQDNLDNKLKTIKLFIANSKTNLNKSIDCTTLLKEACEHGWINIVKMALERKDIKVNRGYYLIPIYV